MFRTTTIGRVTVAIGAVAAAVTISLTAHDNASARPNCQDTVDCPLPTQITTKRSTTTATTLPPPPPPTTTVGPPPPPPTSGPPTPPTTTPPSPTTTGWDPCPVYKPCAELP